MVCQRYPGRRPSDYLEIDDPVDALHLDFAVAYKHRDKDQEYEASKLESIQSMIKPLGQAWGVQYSTGKKKQTEEPASKALPDDLPVEEVLKRLGGKNTMVKHHG